MPHHPAYPQLTKSITAYNLTKPNTCPTKDMHRRCVVRLEFHDCFTQALHAIIRGRHITGKSRHVVVGSLVTVIGR